MADGMNEVVLCDPCQDSILRDPGQQPALHPPARELCRGTDILVCLLLLQTDKNVCPTK